MRNITLGRIPTASWIRSFLALGRVDQNNQLILDHFAFVRIRRSDAWATLGLRLLLGLLLGIYRVHLGILIRHSGLLLLRLLLLLLMRLAGLIVHVWIVHLVRLILSRDVLIHSGSAHWAAYLRVHVRVHVHAVHCAWLLHHNVRWAHVGWHLAHRVGHVPPANWLLIDIAQQLLDMCLRIVWLGIRGKLRKVAHLLRTRAAGAWWHAWHAEIGTWWRGTGLGTRGDAPRAAIGRG